MLEWLARLLGTSDSSKDRAKERLRLVLVQDRALLAPGLLEKLREDIVAVLSQYMEIDEQALEVNLDSSADSVALVANIPVKSVKRRI